MLETLLENWFAIFMIILVIGYVIVKIVRAFKGSDREIPTVASDISLEERMENLISDMDDIREEILEAELQYEKDYLEGKLSDRQKLLDAYIFDFKTRK